MTKMMTLSTSCHSCGRIINNTVRATTHPPLFDHEHTYCIPCAFNVTELRRHTTGPQKEFEGIVAYAKENIMK